MCWGTFHSNCCERKTSLRNKALFSLKSLHEYIDDMTRESVMVLLWWVFASLRKMQQENHAENYCLMSQKVEAEKNLTSPSLVSPSGTSVSSFQRC